VQYTVAVYAGIACAIKSTMDRLLSMQVFEKVVSEGGFAAAARALDLSPAVVSRLVNDLEQHLDARLIQRTTRKFTLTESGNVYLEKLKDILQEVSDAEVAAQNISGGLTGTLQILATPMLAAYFLAPLATKWRKQYPQVVLDIGVDPFSYLRVEEFDVTLMAVEEDFDANIVARVLGRSDRLLCAAPSYLHLAGMPVHPSELRDYAELRFPWHLALGHANGHSMRFTSVADQADPVNVEMKMVLQSVSIDVLLRAALSGAGLCFFAKHLVQQYLNDGRLVHVLPQWRIGGLTIYAALPTRKYVPARVQAMLEFITQAAQEVFPTIKH
jgi:DNA-binding transcriptional LysR family regulator